MTIFDESGRPDPFAQLVGCPHGKDQESCPRCALCRVERDNAAPELPPYPSGMVDGPRSLTAWERTCAEFDAQEELRAKERT